MQLSATASPPCIALVSVPSIGSKAVQQANAASEQLAVIGFSTLYRVEGCAAQSEPGQHRLDGLFQYPLSGRRLCSELITVREKPRVSGFSTLYRVEGCAAESDAVRVDHPGTFQYPLSGRRLCSTTAIGAASTNSNVSVPSIGSKAVQPARNNVEALQILQFQYPLSGRRLCSETRGLVRMASIMCFSTLYRVEGCAAIPFYVLPLRLVQFQYPLSGRRLCSSFPSIRLPPS